VPGFLLDSHIPKAVAPTVRTFHPDCEIFHLADWRDGGFLDVADDRIIRAATEDELVFVSHDINTIPGVVKSLIETETVIAGVALFSSRGFSDDVGALARALADLFTRPEPLDPAYPVVFLRPRR
jgi:hypothetical protein